MSKPQPASARLVHLLDFALRSLCHPYGRVFLRRILLRHPLRVGQGFIVYTRSLARSHDESAYSVGNCDLRSAERGELLVGTGFCQRPSRQAGDAHDCPSPRFGHECAYLDNWWPSGSSLPSDACLHCAIRPLAASALHAGASLAILTSALDIANDILLPALERSTFSHALLAVCPYSVEPIRLALAACGIGGWVFPYHQGACANFTQWLRADVGDKPERTALLPATAQRMLRLLNPCAGPVPPAGCRYGGHIYRPSYTSPGSRA